jgi:sulfur-oxidizing protein SoxZ
MAGKARIKLPEDAKVGDIVEIKALIQHVMETGNRKDQNGNPIPRNIIHTFTATFAGETVFRAEFGSGIAANPYIACFMRVPRAGEYEMTWIDDQGEKTVEKATLSVA